MASHDKDKSRRWKKPMRKRERQVIQIQGLELDLINLQHEISGLENARKLLGSRRLTDGAEQQFVDVVKQFYRLLRHGFGDALWDDDLRVHVDANAVISNIFAAEVEVVTVDNRVERGRDAVKINLLRASAVLAVPQVRLKELHVEEIDEAEGQVVVKGRTETTGQITDYTLGAQFARLHFYPESRAKLMGQKVVVSGSCCYTFDRSSGLIVRVEERVDLASAIGSLLSTEHRELVESNSSIKECLEIIHTEQEASVIYEL